MQLSTLDGDTLGRKRENYNKILQQALSNGDIKPEDINYSNDDLHNLLQIDIASRKKSLEYILEVLKSEDSLYVSRAIKQCHWLIDKEYAHIVNPDFLNNHLFPEMNTKSVNKFNHFIRLNLKDETRVNAFYRFHEKDNVTTAIQWLPYSSIEVIEEAVEKYHDKIEDKLLQKLCNKSFKALELYNSKDEYYNLTGKAIVWLKRNHDKYLTLLESKQNKYPFSNLSAESTKFIMEKCPERIINNFSCYENFIHLATFAKFLKKGETIEFLIKEANKTKGKYSRDIFTDNTLCYFVYKIPEEERFKFLKKLFFDKEDDLESGMKTLRCNVNTSCYKPKHIWYKFAPFDIAFTEITKLIRSSSPSEKKSMFKTILQTVKTQEDVERILKYFVGSHLNQGLNLKHDFVIYLNQFTKIINYNEICWKHLNDIFKSMHIYDIDSKNVADICIHIILLYNIIHKQEVPKEVEEKFSFNTLKDYSRKLQSEEKYMIFTYLFNFITKELNGDINIETDFDKNVTNIDDILQLLIDYDKNLPDYPDIIKRIKYLVKLKKERSWKKDLSHIYNKKKSWKRCMFIESIAMHPCENVCLNSLKHGPELITRHKDDLEKLYNENSSYPKRFLNKIRTFWPKTLASNTEDIYRDGLALSKRHKASIKGLFTLLPKQRVCTLIKDYIPVEAKIDFDNIDENTLSLQRNVAKCMHVARPQPSPNDVLNYAKGDYLQYALPSVNAIFYNLNYKVSKEFIPKVLDSPVSLQKHGLRLACMKYQNNELTQLLNDLWQSTKNASIRALVFKFTFDLLVNSKDEEKIKSIWSLMVTFMDNITFEENSALYDMLELGYVNKIHTSVKGAYFMRCYKFLKLYIPHCDKDKQKYESSLNNLMVQCRYFVDDLDDEFVVNILQELFTKESLELDKDAYTAVNLLSAYLLCSESEESQLAKYKQVLEPRFLKTIDLLKDKDTDNPSLRSNLKQVLTALYHDSIEYIFKKNKVIPISMFENISSGLESLNVPEYYFIIRTWSIAIGFLKGFKKFKGAEDGTLKETYLKMNADFSKDCVEYIRNDVKNLFPCVYYFLAKIFSDVIFNELDNFSVVMFLKHLLLDTENIPAHLIVIKNLERASYYDDDCKEMLKEIHKILSGHQSFEVRMQYYYKFEDQDSNDESADI